METSTVLRGYIGVIMKCEDGHNCYCGTSLNSIEPLSQLSEAETMRAGE